MKQLWAYIRKNNLQDPSNKRKIICDDALRLVFETDSTDMFKMNKLLAKHIIPLEPSSMFMGYNIWHVLVLGIRPSIKAFVYCFCLQETPVKLNG